MAKYLIIEKYHRSAYAYVESGKHFEKMSRHRIPANQLTEKDLDKECDLDAYADGNYFVFELKEQTRGKSKAVKARKSKVSKKKARRKQAR
jgi:hypothetical protein